MKEPYWHVGSVINEIESGRSVLLTGGCLNWLKDTYKVLEENLETPGRKNLAQELAQELEEMGTKTRELIQRLEISEQCRATTTALEAGLRDQIEDLEEDLANISDALEHTTEGVCKYFEEKGP